MNHFKLTLIIFFLNIIGGILSLITNNSWLYDSGIIFLTKLPLTITKISILIFLIIEFLISLFFIYPLKIFYNFFLIISFLIIFFELYFSLNWLINPDSFFNNLKEIWKNNLNSLKLIPIQYKLKCCGFQMINEFFNDKCIESQTLPCLKIMKELYNINISGVGTTLLAHIISHFLILILFYLIVKKKFLDEKSLSPKKKINNNIFIN